MHLPIGRRSLYKHFATSGKPGTRGWPGRRPTLLAVVSRTRAASPRLAGASVELEAGIPEGLLPGGSLMLEEMGELGSEAGSEARTCRRGAP